MIYTVNNNRKMLIHFFRKLHFNDLVISNDNRAGLWFPMYLMDLLE